jgi:N-acetylmuramoyl-L-alanine amidase
LEWTDSDIRVLRLAIILTIAVLAGPAAANLVADMRVIGDEDRTRFIVDLEANPEFRVSRLTNPYRLVIDMPDVEFADPDVGEGRGLISDYRYGLIAPGKARVVLDLTDPVEVVDTFVLDPVVPDPARLVIDIEPTSATEFEIAARQDLPDLSSVETAVAPAPIDSGGRPIVVIDAGHGGIDSGAVGADQLMEKAVTLKFALELERQLRLGAVVEPVLTRDGDEFLSLGERVDFGRHHEAKLLISIHADSVEEDYVRGATVYTLSEDASDALAEALAARENRSDIMAGLSIDENADEEVVEILFELTRRETKNLSTRFANSLVGEIDGTIPLNSNPLRQASFRVLTAPEVPSVLLELGYLSNPDDEAMFRSEDWPDREAEIVARAIEDFLGSNLAAGQ